MQSLCRTLTILTPCRTDDFGWTVKRKKPMRRLEVKLYFSKPRHFGGHPLTLPQATKEHDQVLWNEEEDVPLFVNALRCFNVVLVR